MASYDPLYLGFDLSTQQLKAVAVTSDLKVACDVKFDFDVDSRGFGVEHGVLTNDGEHEVYAPVVTSKVDFRRIRGISGAGQQHGSVYWNAEGERVLQNLDPTKKLQAQLEQAFSYPFSPNWQDASTQEECDQFDHIGEEELALITGSKAHHRFTSPQILRFRKQMPEAYNKTTRISLVSSFFASIFLGKVAPIDISDVCGMNLWDIKTGTWDGRLMDLASGGNPDGLAERLGPIREDGGGSIGSVNPYLVKRFGFDPQCSIAPFTGDNPATILALPLRPMDAVVSLGTSTTFLMSTPYYKPSPSVHFFNHPTTAGLFMFMLCYKNGGLAREQVRDSINGNATDGGWTVFDKAVTTTPPLGQQKLTDPLKLGLYFPRPEIVPSVRAGIWRYNCEPNSRVLAEMSEGWQLPKDDARTIIESQLLSLRLRSANIVEPPSRSADLPAQPRRIYLVGGGSRNLAIAQVAGEILGSVEGVYRLDVGENACALGAAYKAVWAVERGEGETFEDLVGGRWREDEFVEKLAEGYQAGLWERHGVAVKAFDDMEKRVVGSAD